MPDNVLAFGPRPHGVPAEPFLTNEERAQVRAMLREFNAIKHSCPMARRLLAED